MPKRFQLRQTGRRAQSIVAGQRGYLLLASCMLLVGFIVYSGTITMHNTMLQLQATRLRDDAQAWELTRGAAEQLREQLYSMSI